MPKKNSRVAQPGERTNPQGKPVSNRVLLALPDREYPYYSTKPRILGLASSSKFLPSELKDRIYLFS